VSRPGTLAAALVTPRDGESFHAVSMYAVWETPNECTRSEWIFADGSVHRIVAAGDLNIYRGYGGRGSAYWVGRYETVFARMAALGLPFVGPQLPNGRPADPRPGRDPQPQTRDSGMVPQLTVVRESLIMTGPGCVGCVSSVASVARAGPLGAVAIRHEDAADAAGAVPLRDVAGPIPCHPRPSIWVAQWLQNGVRARGLAGDIPANEW